MSWRRSNRPEAVAATHPRRLPGSQDRRAMLDGDTPFALFRDDLAARDTLFHAPLSTVVANDPGEFLPALAALEDARRAGKWLAGYFSYEAGYLSEPKLRPLLPAGRRTPLIAFGVFDAPSERVTPRPPSAASNGPIFE